MADRGAVFNMIENALLSQLLRELNIRELPRSWFTKFAVSDRSIALDGKPVDPRASLDIVGLEKDALVCSLCSLGSTRQKVVFGEGNVNSPKIAFVGEGPGAEEDQQGIPFVGKAGKLLTDAIEKGLCLKRSDVYICNVVKCRPPGNRTPLPEEVSACAPYLYRQLELIKPRVIVTLGQTPQLALSGKDIGITKLRGQWQNWRGIPLMPTFHPAYILRNPSAKRPFWEDLQEVMRFLDLR